MSTPARPKYVRITGPSNDLSLEVGQVYHVWSWDDDAPVVRDDDEYMWTLAPAGVAGSKFYPAWEPYVCAGEEAS